MPTPPERARRRPVRRYDPQDKRARLIAAAAVVIGERGLAGATVPLISRRAGVSRGLIHYHFPNMAALVHAAAQQHYAEWLAALQTAAQAAPDRTGVAVEAVATARALVAQAPAFWAARAAFVASAPHDPTLAEILAAGDRDAAQLIGPCDVLVCGFATRPAARRLEAADWEELERAAVAVTRGWRRAAAV